MNQYTGKLGISINEIELAKLQRRVPILLHHLKPPCIERIFQEVKRLKNPDLDFLEQGREYQF